MDLAIIATPASQTPDLVDACGAAGVKCAVVVSTGFSESGADGTYLELQLIRSAQKHGLRILGPNSLGLARPLAGLNATLAEGLALSGSIGFVSQSGALCAAVLDYARANRLGFSSVVSLGVSADLDFGEVLDYLASDYRTDAILVHVEGIRDARRFVSSLRAAARAKPVMVLKVGHHPLASRAAHAHTGSITGDDAVFEAVFRRSGAVRLDSLTQLYSNLKGLFLHVRPRGNRLAIITNGGGPGVMAADRAADIGIPLAEFAESTIEKLNACLPSGWSHGNPVDILGDAGPERYRAALKAVLEGPNVDGVLVMLTPQAVTDPSGVADVVIELEKTADKPVLVCWMGEELVAEARAKFSAAGIPHFRTPEPAVELFSHISAYYQNQKLLMQTPSSLSHLPPPSIESARLVIEMALSERRKKLNEMESKALLAAFRIPIAQTVVARSAAEAMVLSAEIGLPVVMKIDSPNIVHKSEVGGVRLNIRSLAAVRSTYQEILDEVKRVQPEAVINGIAIEPMIQKRNGRELVVSVRRDPVFGPAITFGEGGNLVEENRDVAVALPPLNSFLVKDMIRSTRISTRLGEFRNMPAVDMNALELVLLRISEMVCELPWITAMEINPLIVDENGVVAVDANISVENVSPTADRYDHVAIHPYPSHLISTWTVPDGTTVTIRPIKPEDAELEVDFVRRLSAETKYYRFMNTMRELPPAMVARLTQIDYDREMAFVATLEADGVENEIGVCRYAVNPDGESCEFAVVVADDWQHRGLARKLMGVLIETARSRGIQYMNGVFLANNERMLKFVQKLGFVLSNDPEDSSVKLGILALQD